MSTSPPEILFAGRYRLSSERLTGGSAIVQKALDVRLNRWVAIKTPSTELARDAKALAEFEEEGRMLAGSDHENIVRVWEFIDAGKVDESCHIVCEWCEQSLAQLIGDAVVPMGRRLDLVRQLCAAVAYLHEEKDLIHADLTPKNVLIGGQRGIAKLADFGNSVSPGLVRSLRPTYQYSAPEIFNHSVPIAKPVDIYALGMTCYELLVGPEGMRRAVPEIYSNADGRSLPLRWFNWQLDARKVLPPAHAVDERVPPDVSRLLERMTSKTVTERPTASEALHTLAGVIPQVTPIALEDPQVKIDAARRQRRMVLGTTFAVLFFAGAGIIWAARGVIAEHFFPRPEPVAPVPVPARASVPVVQTPPEPPAVKLLIDVVPENVPVTINGTSYADGQTLAARAGESLQVDVQATGFKPLQELVAVNSGMQRIAVALCETTRTTKVRVVPPPEKRTRQTAMGMARAKLPGSCPSEADLQVRRRLGDEACGATYPGSVRNPQLYLQFTEEVEVRIVSGDSRPVACGLEVSECVKREDYTFQPPPYEEEKRVPNDACTSTLTALS
jgi:hypothetical protein